MPIEARHHQRSLVILLSVSAVVILLSWSKSTYSQSFLGMPSADLSLASDTSPRSRVLDTLQNHESEFESRLDAFQLRFGWRLERLAEQRQTLQQNIQTLTEQRDALDPFDDAERRQLLGELIVRTRQLGRGVRQIQDAYDNLLSALTDGASLARQLGIQVESLSTDPTLTVADVQARLAQIDEQLESLQSQRSSLQTDRAELQSQLDEHQDLLQEARTALHSDIAGLERRLLQLRVQSLDRGRELDRQRIEIVNVELEKLATRRPALEYRAAFYRDELELAIERQEGTVWDRSPSHFDAANISALADHSVDLVRNWSDAWQAATNRLSIHEDSVPNVPALIVFGLLTLGAWPLFVAIRRLAERVGEPGQRPPFYKSIRLLALVLPVSLLLVGAIALDVLIAGMHGIAWVLVLAPPAWIAVGLLIRILYPIGGTEHLAARGARSLRTVMWATAIAVTVLMVISAAMPVLGYPTGAQLPIRGLAILLVLLGISIVLARRRIILTRFGLSKSRQGALASTLRRIYPILAWAPLVVGSIHLAGYHELSKVILRRGVVVMAVLSILPWAHLRLQSALRDVLGYPHGGGPFSSSEASAQRGYRVLAPLLTVVVGAVGLLVIASSWGLEGSIVGNVSGVLQAELLSLGETRITLLSLALVSVAIVGTIALTRWLLPLLRERVYPIYDLTEGMRAAFDTVVKYTLFLIGLLVTLQVIGLGLGFLAIFAGVIGVAVGFGSQTLAANFISGLIIQFSKPVSVGDHIEVEGVVGRIQRISSYATVVRTFENVSVIVPNSVLIDEKVVNWTEGEKRRRFNIDVGVAYGSDVQLVTELLLEVAERHDGVLATPAPSVKFQEFGDSSLNFALQIWVQQPGSIYSVASEIRYAIDETFRENDVEIPFPQRDLHLRSAEGVISIAQSKG